MGTNAFETSTDCICTAPGSYDFNCICISCEVGFYCSLSVKTACPVGKTTANTRSTLSSDCSVSVRTLPSLNVSLDQCGQSTLGRFLPTYENDGTSCSQGICFNISNQQAASIYWFSNYDAENWYRNHGKAILLFYNRFNATFSSSQRSYISDVNLYADYWYIICLTAGWYDDGSTPALPFYVYQSKKGLSASSIPSEWKNIRNAWSSPAGTANVTSFFEVSSNKVILLSGITGLYSYGNGFLEYQDHDKIYRGKLGFSEVRYHKEWSDCSSCWIIFIDNDNMLSAFYSKHGNEQNIPTTGWISNPLYGASGKVEITSVVSPTFAPSFAPSSYSPTTLPSIAPTYQPTFLPSSYSPTFYPTSDPRTACQAGTIVDVVKIPKSLSLLSRT